MSERRKFRVDIVMAVEIEAVDIDAAGRTAAGVAAGLANEFGAPRGWSGRDGWTTVLHATPQEVSEV